MTISSRTRALIVNAQHGEWKLISLAYLFRNAQRLLRTNSMLSRAGFSVGVSLAMLSAPHLGAKASPATKIQMSLYAKVAGINLCNAIKAGQPFDTAVAISGETIAQVISGSHNGRISELGGDQLDLEELRRGAINMAILSAYELCRETMPANVRENVEVATTKSGNTGENRVAIAEQSRGNSASSVANNSSREHEISQHSSVVNSVVRIDGPGASGSGVIVKREANSYTLVSACHVLRDVHQNEEILIATYDQKKHVASTKDLRRSGQSDLCSLIFRSTTVYETAKIDRETQLAIGLPVELIGWAIPTADLPPSLRLTNGSITGMALAKNNEGYSVMYTTNPPSLPGMSGGPVVYEGKVIAIHGRAERFGSFSYEGKQMATSYSLGISLRDYVN